MAIRDNAGSIVGIALVVVLLISVPAESSSPERRWCMNIGHRGAAGLAPENTLAAIARALDEGVDAVEIDVQLSADREVVVHHDFALKPETTRTPNGEWLGMWDSLALKSLSREQLKTYDVGRLEPHSTYARRYPAQEPADGQRIPTLSEVIGLIKAGSDQKVELWIEIKTSPEEPALSADPIGLGDAVAAVLDRHDFSNRVKILSFDWRALVHLQQVVPQLPTIYLTHVGRRLNTIKPGRPGPSPWTAGIDVDDFGGSIPQAIKAAGGRNWAPHYKYLNPKRMAEARQMGLAVYVWTPDRAEDMARLLRLGVAGIITNRPDRLKSVIARNKAAEVAKP